jgi:hypothetical protein
VNEIQRTQNQNRPMRTNTPRTCEREACYNETEKSEDVDHARNRPGPTSQPGAYTDDRHHRGSERRH